MSHLCPNLLDMCSKLPGTSTFALSAVLGTVWPHTLNTFYYYVVQVRLCDPALLLFCTVSSGKLVRAWKKLV